MDLVIHRAKQLFTKPSLGWLLTFENNGILALALNYLIVNHIDPLGLIFSAALMVGCIIPVILLHVTLMFVVFGKARPSRKLWYSLLAMFPILVGSFYYLFDMIIHDTGKREEVILQIVGNLIINGGPWIFATLFLGCTLNN